MENGKGPKEENMKNGDDVKVFEEGNLDEENGIFNFDELRLPQDYSDIVGVKKALITVPVRKPHRQEFIRVRPGDAWRFETVVLELKEERETYLVDSKLWGNLPGEIIPKVLFLAINRQGTLKIWPVRLPGEDGRHDHWNRSALEAAKRAETRWVRVAANMNLGAYEVFEASADFSEPEWPDFTLQKILEIAFKNQIIKSEDHPIIKRLRGVM